MIKLKGLLKEETNNIRISGQTLITGEYGKIKNSADALNKKFPNWKFKVFSEYRTKFKDTYTLTYDSESTNDGEIDRVKKLIKKVFSQEYKYR